MAREHTRRVNQKLNHARQHLLLAEQADTENAQQGLLESTVFHLIGSYRAFLAELCGENHMASLQTVNDFQTAQNIESYCDGFVPAALAQCIELERNKTWLADLFTAELQCDAVVAKAPVPTKSLMIVVDNSGDKLTLESCRQWIAQLNNLIDELRESLLEC